jgi:hypothetical protein
MKTGIAVVALLMLLTGSVWIGQGLGYIKGSFMTGDMHWFWIGVVLVVVGLTLGGVLLRPEKKKTLP